MAVSPGLKYKQSSMPFVQMENISHFLRACQIPPLSLPPHDVFLTVDLYEGKDPAQVLQCIMSFSRRANAVQPGKFRRTIGPQSNKGGNLSPNVTGSTNSFARLRGNSNVSANSSGSAPSTPAKSPAVSSWSKKSDETVTAPAWNIHQYGYMGGADQGNQGVVFGGRRQITTAAPVVPSLAEKERRRRETEEQAVMEKQEAGHAHQQQREAEEEQARLEEERRWEEEAARFREQERQDIEHERKRWDEEKRQWEEEEQRRRDEEREVEERMEQEKLSRRSAADNRLNGQFLSQYQASQAGSPKEAAASGESQERQRIKELEQELELARARERQYEHDIRKKENDGAESQGPRRRPVPAKPSYTLSSLEQERRMLRTEWQKNQDEETAPPTPPRPLPDPTKQLQQPSRSPEPQHTSPRPLPDPTKSRDNRVDRFLASKPASHRPPDYTTTAEVDAENSRRETSQQKTRAGGWASKSLLEREMEAERERQREWEDNQKETQEAAAKGLKDPSQGSGPGGSWNVFQYGYMGGDNQARGGPGLSSWGARRQIIGPRPPP